MAIATLGPGVCVGERAALHGHYSSHARSWVAARSQKTVAVRSARAVAFAIQ